METPVPLDPDRPSRRTRVFSRIAVGFGFLTFIDIVAASIAYKTPGKPGLFLLLTGAVVLWGLACIFWFTAPAAPRPEPRRKPSPGPAPAAAPDVAPAAPLTPEPAHVLAPAPAGVPAAVHPDAEPVGPIEPLELDVSTADLDLAAAGSGPVGFTDDELADLRGLDVGALTLTSKGAREALAGMGGTGEDTTR